MDLQFFIKVLLRRKWLILASMIIAAIAAFVLVGMQDREYKANAILSTGIMGAQGLNVDREIPFFQQFQIEMSVNNMIEFINSRQNVNLLSYKLLLHDLKENKNEPFRQMKIDEEEPFEYTENDVLALLDVLEVKVDSLHPYLNDPVLESIYKDLAKAYEYDHESLLENMEIGRRTQDSDLLNVEFVSEKPDLCTYVVNNFCNILLENHRNLRQKKDKDLVEFYTILTESKERELENKERQLNSFRGGRGLVDLGGQKESNITQIKELELNLEDYLQRKVAAEKNIKDLSKYLGNYGSEGEDDSAKILSSKSINEISDRIKKLNEAYIESGNKDEKIRIAIEANQAQLERQIQLHAKARKGSENTTDASGDNILSKKVEAEMELNLSTEAIKSIQNELARLRGKSQVYISSDAIADQLRRDLEVIKGEYINIKSELNKATINLKNVADQLNLLESAQLPDEPEPSGKAIISAFAGIVAAVLATLIIFILAYFDTSLSTPSQFEKFTELNLLGKMTKVKTKDLDLAHLYNSNGKVKTLDVFRESMRNMRYLIENSGASTFLFTSTKADEGKTFTLINLAQSFKIKNKKVLLIDTNFKKNTLTQIAGEPAQAKLDLQKLIVEHNLADIFGIKELNGLFNISDIEVIANSGNYLSPAEIFAGKDFHTFLDKLTLHYDYIFFEAPAMNNYSDTKELVGYAEKVIAVFSADSDLNPADKESLNFIRNLGNKFMGAILNKVELKNLN